MLHTNPGTVQGIRLLPRRDSNGAGPDRRTQADLGRPEIYQEYTTVTDVGLTRPPIKGDIMWSGKPIEPQTAEEIEQIKTPNGIRQRINEARRYDPLVRQVFDLAYQQGLSGEDLYTLLAYHALVTKQKLELHIVENYMVRPSPPITIKGE
jgi:hypothetical protein